jgi:hypothetical protein
MSQYHYTAVFNATFTNKQHSFITYVHSEMSVYASRTDEYLEKEQYCDNKISEPKGEKVLEQYNLTAYYWGKRTTVLSFKNKNKHRTSRVSILFCFCFQEISKFPSMTVATFDKNIHRKRCGPRKSLARHWRQWFYSH